MTSIGSYDRLILATVGRNQTFSLGLGKLQLLVGAVNVRSWRGAGSGDDPQTNSDRMDKTIARCECRAIWTV